MIILILINFVKFQKSFLLTFQIANFGFLNSFLVTLVSYRGDPGLITSKGMGNLSAMLYFVTSIMSEDGGSRPRLDLCFA